MQARPRIRSGITTSLRIHLSSCRTARSSEICGPVQAAKFRCSSWSPSSQLRRKNDEPRRNIMAKLEGKTALVTGGNSGIGLATAKQFVNEGAYVFITGRRESELAAAVKEIGKNVTGLPRDVANLGDLDRLLAQIKGRKGKLEIVFANAGATPLA